MSRGASKRPRKASVGGISAPVATPAGLVAVMAEPPTSKLPTSSILIQVNPLLPRGFIHGRCDILIRGRVVSTSPAQEVALHVGGALVTAIQFGEPEYAAPMALPDRLPAFQRSFHFHLPRSAEIAASACRAVISARTAADEAHEEAFDLVVDPTDATAVILDSGPHQPASDSSIRPPLVLYVERAAVDPDGLLQVHGWAISLTAIVDVQVFLDDAVVSSAVLGGTREDVAGAHPAYPNAGSSGFVLTARLDATNRNASGIRAQAIGRYGFVHQIVVPLQQVSCHPLPAIPPVDAAFEPATAAIALQPNPSTPTGLAVAPLPGLEPPGGFRDINMYCDLALLTADGQLTVSGWAVSGGGIATIYVYLDDTLVGAAVHGRDRPDVGLEYPELTAAGQSGFLFDRRVADSAAGEPVVRVVVRSTEGLERSETIPVGTILPARGVDLPPVAQEPASGDAQAFRFELDSPRIVGNAVPDPITGRLTIEGWVLARSGVAGIDVLLDGQRLGEAHYGLARQDVAGAFPEWENALRSGYAFHCPPRGLRDGDHEVQLVVRANSGAEYRQSFAITVQKSESQDDSGTIRRRVTRTEADLFDALISDMVSGNADGRPAFDLRLRQTGAVDPDNLTATLESLRLQCYRDWHLTVLVDTPDQRQPLADVIASFDGDLTGFVSVVGTDDPAWQAPLGQMDAGGHHLIGLLCPGDELGSDALAELALASLLHPSAAFLYADEARISPASHEREPFFKPDFSPDLLLSTNYIGRPWVARSSLIASIGITPASLAVAGEYDLVLRATEQAAEIHHLPKLLCRRGAADLDDVAMSEAALRGTLARREIEGIVLPSAVDGSWRVKRVPRHAGKVSIVIPTCAAHGYIETCLTTLRDRTSYADYEVVVIDNIPDTQMAWKVWLQKNADKVVDMPDAFNWSRFNNLAADVADGEYLLFLNDDIEFEQDDWLDVLLEHAQRADVGVVGARLLYPDRKVQHAGMFLSNNGIGRHAFRFAAEDEPGYFGLALTQRNVMAVTGACMLVRREVFHALGRFDEAHQIVNNDLDFCLRAHKAGLLTVFTPYATLIHHELASRDRLKDVFDLSHFNAHWKTLFAAGDPYFSPMLSRHADDYRPDDEAVEAVHAANPLFRADDIKRILVVKLDHIGDFVTALPAIRRLKSLFPHAHLTVLAGPASRAFASLEPAIDAFVEFAFFHARSQLGERDLTPDDYTSLAAQLRPHRFDLAVDLRKHLSTRDVLQHTGARFLAGFDHMGQFPFLDIALEWEGDKALHRKRGHIVDELLSLVAAIGLAADADRQLMRPGHEPSSGDAIPEAVRPLFAKPVVAIHPGAGNITKQWPEEHFSALIDLLTERNGVNVLLVGGSEERELAAWLIANVLNPAAVASVAGETSLTALPRILAACALYIGNDSGPKHIAAGLGVPTIGIHSGVVDAIEWGPVGPRAVALRRNMTCSPCYLAVAADCPRNLACLRLLEPVHVHLMAQKILARPVGASPALTPAEPPVKPARVGKRTAKPRRGVRA